MNKIDFKLAIVGLDGLTTEILLKTVDRRPRKLRFLHNITRSNKTLVSSIMSTVPYITPVSWPAIATGMDISKYGITDFFIYRLENGKIYSKPISGDDIPGSPLWNELGKRYRAFNIVINVPPFYPARPIRGVMVAGFPAPRLTIWPKHLMNLARRHKYRIYIDTSAIDYRSEKYFLSELIDVVRARTMFTLDLLQRYDWNFLFVVYLATDTLMHMYGHNIYKCLFEKQNRGSCKYVDEHLVHVLEFIDMLIGRLIKEADVILLVSDHGNTPVNFEININEILRKSRALRLKETKDRNITRLNANTLFKELSLLINKKTSINRLLKHAFIPMLSAHIKPLHLRSIDLAKSLAFAVGTIQPSTLLYVRRTAQNIVNKILTSLETRKIIKKVTDLGINVDKWNLYLVEAEKGYTFNPVKIGSILRKSSRQCDHSPLSMYIEWQRNSISKNTETNVLNITQIYSHVINLFEKWWKHGG